MHYAGNAVFELVFSTWKMWITHAHNKEHYCNPWSQSYHLGWIFFVIQLVRITDLLASYFVSLLCLLQCMHGYVVNKGASCIIVA